LTLYLRKKLVKCCILRVGLYDAETWALWKVDQKYLEIFKCGAGEGWRQLDNRVRNEEVLHRVKEDRNVLQTIKRREANWIGHMLHRHCLLQHATEGKVEGSI
jgi:hypothetical protein